MPDDIDMQEIAKNLDHLELRSQWAQKTREKWDQEIKAETTEIEKRLIRAAEYTRHPDFAEYVEFCEETYGEHPMVTMMRDLAWQRERGINEDELEPPEGPLHPRYGRVMGRQTFYPFEKWLMHKKDLQYRSSEPDHRHPSKHI